jgi:cell wall-associated NlpC family hydrolase
MRRFLLACVVVFLSAGVAFSISPFSAFAQSGSEAGSSAVSQGSIATEPHVDISEGSSPGYSQVVDNSTKERFEASEWEQSSGEGQYDESYGHASSTSEGGASPASFKVRTPTTGYYSLYAWWPAGEDNNSATRFGISTTSGIKWTEVDQQKDGGMWVRLGAWKMAAGDRYAVQVSRTSEGDGEVIADAVMVLSGRQASPEQATDEQVTGAGIMAASGGRPDGHDVVRKARWHIGTPYVASPPHRCKAYRKEDCSCHTKVVFRKFGRRLPDNPARQWKHGRRIAKSHLRPGDLVFFDENKNGRLQPWDHVGIYSGNGFLVHASSYFGEVVESKMKYIHGYWGAKRLKRLH